MGLDVQSTNAIGMKFRLIPPGQFVMGTGDKELAESINEAKLEGISYDWLISAMEREAPQQTVTMPHHHTTCLPMISAFKDAHATSKTLALSAVTDESNQNLMPLQKMLLQWHYRLGHLGFQTVQWIG